MGEREENGHSHVLMSEMERWEGQSYLNIMRIPIELFHKLERISTPKIAIKNPLNGHWRDLPFNEVPLQGRQASYN